jgi:hypothetical protein
MFRHVVCLKWVPGTTPAQHDAVIDGLRGLPAQIAEIRSYSVGADAHINADNHDLVVVADFDDIDGYLVYRDHPEHQAVIATCIKPILSARAAVQYPM